jgi:hypothetical protein
MTAIAPKQSLLVEQLLATFGTKQTKYREAFIGRL